jgi:DME family drug/metabolite transporter
VLDQIPSYVFALMSSFLFALGDQFQALGLQGMTRRTGATVNIAASAIVFWLLAPWFLDPSLFTHPGILWFILIGLIRPALSANLAIAGIHHLGPTLAGTFTSVSPLFGAAFGIFLLGEVLTWPVAVGTAGIVCAIVMLASGGRRTTATWPVWALLFPLGAAAVRSTSHAVTKIGMLEIPDPYFAALIAFSISAVLTLGAQQFSPSAERITFRGVGARWFFLAGTVFAASVLLLNQALLTGDIIIVVPIIAAAPVFTMLMSWLVFRREKITPRTLLALALVLPSVVLIVALGHR